MKPVRRKHFSGCPNCYGWGYAAEGYAQEVAVYAIRQCVMCTLVMTGKELEEVSALVTWHSNFAELPKEIQ